MSSTNFFSDLFVGNQLLCALLVPMMEWMFFVTEKLASNDDEKLWRIFRLG